jgi:hypothetical protein
VIIRTAADKDQWFLTPCIGIINETHYYGYPVIDIAFAWLIWRAKIQIGVRKVKFEEDAA